MIIVYYSRGSALPALLAAIKHCRPALLLPQARSEASAWRRRHYPAGEPPFFLKQFGSTFEGDLLYLMTASVPPPLIKRTFDGFYALLKGEGDAGLLLAPLPSWHCRQGLRSMSPRREAAFWLEIEAVVEQTRLQVELIDKKR